MINKIIKFTFLGLLIVGVFSLIAWVIFEFTLDDPKGEENAVKKIFYQAASILPVYPAVDLTVPYHHQQHALSCEVASLTMALNYKGVKVTENELIAQLPFSFTGPRQTGNIWGDPNLGFVGNIDGTMPNTGYGVYEQPIYDLASKYRSAKIITNGTVADLITELVNGNPIVVWGVVGSGKDISWKTPNGKVISAKLDEHARTLIGFTGTSDNPKLLILDDPIYGKIRMSVSSFQKNWGMLDNRAVVIY
ncbi:MAG: C39 family peptidase [Patescibacteria group bacterium]|nr:C39 family peptidase [Patescibacteria group bacterium]